MLTKRGVFKLLFVLIEFFMTQNEQNLDIIPFSLHLCIFYTIALFNHLSLLNDGDSYLLPLKFVGFAGSWNSIGNLFATFVFFA